MEKFPTKSRVVSLDAKPEPIAIDTASTAVIVVDMQNDFGSKGGLFDRAGIDISGIQKVIAPPQKSWPQPVTLALKSSISRWAFVQPFRT